MLSRNEISKVISSELGLDITVMPDHFVLSGESICMFVDSKSMTMSLGAVGKSDFRQFELTHDEWLEKSLDEIEKMGLGMCSWRDFIRPALVKLFAQIKAEAGDSPQDIVREIMDHVSSYGWVEQTEHFVRLVHEDGDQELTVRADSVTVSRDGKSTDYKLKDFVSDGEHIPINKAVSKIAELLQAESDKRKPTVRTETQQLYEKLKAEYNEKFVPYLTEGGKEDPGRGDSWTVNLVASEDLVTLTCWDGGMWLSHSAYWIGADGKEYSAGGIEFTPEPDEERRLFDEVARLRRGTDTAPPDTSRVDPALLDAMVDRVKDLQKEITEKNHEIYELQDKLSSRTLRYIGHEQMYDENQYLKSHAKHQEEIIAELRKVLTTQGILISSQQDRINRLSRDEKEGAEC